MTHTLTQSDLRQFTGSEVIYRHALVRQVLYTEGVRHVAQAGGAYWLIDDIAFAQCGVVEVKAEAFQVWKLTVKPDNSATLACEDGNGRVVISKELPFTDFPLPEMMLYYCNNTLLLPSEY